MLAGIGFTGVWLLRFGFLALRAVRGRLRCACPSHACRMTPFDGAAQVGTTSVVDADLGR